MSVWRRKAIEAFPDMARDVEHPDTTIYQTFFWLLPRAEEAHKRDDTEELQRIYGFAEWCFHQKSEDLWNAAGVAFYEHLADEPITREQIPRWLSPDVFEGCKSLFEYRLFPDQFKELCEKYARRNEPPQPPFLYPCPACGSLVFENPPGSFEICPVCCWEDDIVQLGFPLMKGGANNLSLYEFQLKMLEEKRKRSNAPEERPESISRDPLWRPFDPSHDPHLQGDRDGDIKRMERSDQDAVLYYWRDNYWLAEKKHP